MRIRELIVDPGREEHIARHHVSVEEVRELVFSGPFVTRTRHRRFRFIGQTAAGRYITVIAAPRGRGVFGLVTARDADDSERRRYRALRRR